MKFLETVSSERTAVLMMAAAISAGALLGSGCRLRLHTASHSALAPAEMIAVAPVQEPVLSGQEMGVASEIEVAQPVAESVKEQAPAPAYEPVTPTPPVAESLEPASVPQAPATAQAPEVTEPLVAAQEPELAQAVARSAEVYGTEDVQLAEGPFPDGRPVLYRVKKGDTYSELSQKFLGKAKYWPQILHVNTDQKPKALKVGSIILIPRAPAKKAPATPVEVKAPAQPATATAAAPEAVPQPVSTNKPLDPADK